MRDVLLPPGSLFHLSPSLSLVSCLSLSHDSPDFSRPGPGRGDARLPLIPPPAGWGGLRGDLDGPGWGYSQT